jgi:hypothetical protein
VQLILCKDTDFLSYSQTKEKNIGGILLKDTKDRFIG